jgi:hypothetical protein
MRFPLVQAGKGTMSEEFEDYDLPDLTAWGERRNVDHAVRSLLPGEVTSVGCSDELALNRIPHGSTARLHVDLMVDRV